MTTDETGNAPSEDVSDETAIVPPDPQTFPLLLGGSVEIDLSVLPQDQRVALQVEYAKGMIDLERRAKEIGVDVLALDRTLRTMAETTHAVSASKDAVTITNTQDNSLGRTEIIMGNTEHAMKGRLTKSQTGERDLVPYLIGLGIVATAVIGVMLARGG